ncbi:glutathione S-transferase family protein [Dyella telluris]|uniref:Glutathione S-transferase family protein n=1 Tax=Dyella telluris TaxID=2763498 RepID=A0A7G8Q1A6_9GAMM|nr:glutathione S-transferase family protein [Dyella telluris]QNK00564.1 glutathione S-transferase family protein [Dyella telluris]
MELIGMLDSPYVRRAAISLRLLGIPFKHRSLSVFRNFDEFQQINPLVKAPTLVLDDGSLLTESSLIIDWAQAQSSRRTLMPADRLAFTRAIRLVGLALAASEKSVQIVYEHKRDADKRDEGWMTRVKGQLRAAFQRLESELQDVDGWLFGTTPGQADVSIAVAWGFAQLVVADVVDAKAYPNVRAFAERAEKHPDFAALPQT